MAMKTVPKNNHFEHPVQVYTHIKHNYFWARNSHNTVMIKIFCILTDKQDIFMFPEEQEQIGMGIVISPEKPTIPICSSAKFEKYIHKNIISGLFKKYKIEMSNEMIVENADKITHTYEQVLPSNIVIHDTYKALYNENDNNMYVFLFVELPSSCVLRITPNDFYVLGYASAIATIASRGKIISPKGVHYNPNIVSIGAALLIAYGDLRMPMREIGW